MGRVYTRKDRTGDVVGRLTVLVELPEKNGRHWMWECVCECGNKIVLSAAVLSCSATKSCGCLKIDVASEMCINRNTTHGMSQRGSRSKEYMAWGNVKSRTTNPNNKSYKRYHDLGRVMSKTLRDNFNLFLTEVGFAPIDGRDWSVGRINNNMGYVEGNIQWELDNQQARNKKQQDNNTTGVTGVSLCLSGRGKGRLVATWRGLDGKAHTKSFSIMKFGYDNALALATNYRENMISKMNIEGAGYSQYHGNKLIKENYVY